MERQVDTERGERDLYRFMSINSVKIACFISVYICSL